MASVKRAVASKACLVPPASGHCRPANHCTVFAPPRNCLASYTNVTRLTGRSHCQKSSIVLKAHEQGNSGTSRDPNLEDYVEVKVDQVRVSQGASIVYLRVLDGKNLVLPVHVGEPESSALLKEINKQRQMRPLTHDLFRNLLSTIAFRVVKVRITDIVANTYYARIHVCKFNAQGQMEPESEVDVDARPSDAINLAVRFGAPMYVNKRIADMASTHMPDLHATTTNETHAEIVRSCREALTNFEDPTVMFTLQKDLAIRNERFEDARMFQQRVFEEMTHNPVLRNVVAMEAALADGRYEEAARLRDEHRKMIANMPSDQTQRRV